MNFSNLISYLVLVYLVSSAALHVNGQEDRAIEWFHSEYANYFKPNLNDTTPPTITESTIVPSFLLKVGAPVADITASVYDPAGIKTVYALVGNRMNLMVDLTRTGQYAGYCGSNLAPGSYKVTIVAIDRAGNAARAEAATNLTILNPRDLNGNHIEDSLENQLNKSLRVIVLGDSNLSGAEKFKILPGISMIVPGSKLDELAHLKGVKGIYEDKKLKILASPGDYSSLSRGIDDPRKGHRLKGDGVTVALLDTGADSRHESLKGQKIIAFKDFVNNQTGPYDDNGHGTHCADLIAGDGNQDGVAPDASLVVLKVMNKDGECYISDAIKALDWCLENKDRYGIKVISFSVGARVVRMETLFWT